MIEGQTLLSFSVLQSNCYNLTVTMAQAMLRSDDNCGDSSGDIDVTTTVSATVRMKGKYRTYTAAWRG